MMHDRDLGLRDPKTVTSTVAHRGAGCTSPAEIAEPASRRTAALERCQGLSHCTGVKLAAEPGARGVARQIFVLLGIARPQGPAMSQLSPPRSHLPSISVTGVTSRNAPASYP